MTIRREPFGWTGVGVPVIGQGTWRTGESRHADGEIAALRLGLDLGMTHIDTAEMYGSGVAEEIVAAAIRDFPRAELFIVSKVLPQNASYVGTIAACEASLRRLRIETLDLYLLHWQGRHPIAETMRAMEDLVAAGKIRHHGVSNFDVDEMRQAMAALTRTRLACNQVLYNLAHRGIERDLLPFCEEEEIALVGYTPFGGMPGRGSAGLAILEEIARRRGRTVRQVVLSFLTRKPHLFAIPKAGRPEHVRENAGGGDLVLPAEDIDAIDAAFPAPRRRVPLATA